MQNSRYSSLVFLCAIVLAIGIFSCGKEEVAPPPTQPTTEPAVTTPTTPVLDLTEVRKNIATNTASNIIIPSYRNLQAQTDELVSKIEAFTNEPTPSTLEAAQIALKDSWMAWQSASIYLFGPSEAVALRKSLNTYPTDTDQISVNVETGDYILGSIANQAAIGLSLIHI